MKPRQSSRSTKYRLVYRKEKEGGYSGYCLELPGAISQGETLDELKENLVDAIKLIREDMMQEAKAEEKENRLLEVTV
jgi:predicted RNase H-like HicB family nuclease